MLTVSNTDFLFLSALSYRYVHTNPSIHLLPLQLRRLPNNHPPKQRILNPLPDPLIQADDRLIPEPPLRLINIKVPRHTRILHLLARQIRRPQPQKPKHNPHQRRDEQADILRQRPHLRDLRLVPGGRPASAREVEEVDGAVVRDEEGLAVGFFVVEGGGFVAVEAVARGQQGGQAEVVRVGDVGDFGEVEEVVVAADLDFGLPFEVGA